MKSGTIDFFASLNMPVVGLYGLSETSAGATLQEFPVAKLDKIGKPLPGSQIKIFNPDINGFGEVCMRGRHVFLGYLGKDKATWDAFDSEGYFHSGDKGCLDQDGFLKLTGRIKEIIITSGGENVAPTQIELKLKQNCPLLNHVMLVGEARKYLGALLTLKVIIDKKTGIPTNQLTEDARDMLAKKLDLDCQTVE